MGATTVTYTQTKRDLLAFYFHVMTRRTTMLRAGGVCVAASSLINAMTIDWSKSDAWAVFVVLESLFLLFLAALLLVIVCASVAAMKGPGIICEHTVTFTDESITEVTAFNTQVVRWPGVSKVVRSDGQIAVFLGPAMAHVIPRRAVGSLEEWDLLCGSIMDRFHSAHP